MLDDWKFISSATICFGGKPSRIHEIRPTCGTLKDAFLYPLSILVRKWKVPADTPIRLYVHDFANNVRITEMIDYETANHLLQGYGEESPARTGRKA